MPHVPCYMSLCTEHTQHTQHVPCSSSLNRYFVTQQTQCSMFHIRIFCLRHILRDGCSHVLITNMFVNLREVTGQSGDLIAFAWTFIRNVHFLDHISTLRPQGKQLDAPYAHLLGLPATQTTGERPGAWGDYQVTPNPSNRKEGKHTVCTPAGGGSPKWPVETAQAGNALSAASNCFNPIARELPDLGLNTKVRN